ncbi:cell shape determination protein CcmA [Solemya velesiana gill symbiont]|uniref:Cell shape determination protein CcmA n=1 Tax=Solemya velesiana gill symbiont TaxID=1918948 RepID=A0A1T2KXU5_9GAMM|nr:cell shape determination protein CcmA [Solemya velesiana gill symbiont]
MATVIGTGTNLTGDVTFSGGLHVDGTITGNVIGEPDGRSALTLSDKGVVEGDVRVPNIILNGKVVGDVYASERVELAPNAKVTGIVYYKLLEMAMGAEVNGQLVHTEDVEPKRLSYENTESAENAENAEAGPLSQAEVLERVIASSDKTAE